MGQAAANCACVPQAGGAVVETLGDIKRQSASNGSETGDDYTGGTPLSVLALRSEIVLARRRVFSPHLRTSFTQHYRVIRQVGEGTYGNVFEAESREPQQKDPEITGSGDEGGATPSKQPRRVAVKCFKVSQLGSEDAASMGARTLKESFEKERAILARAEHPHIVKMYECFEARNLFWIVLELCRGGELYELVAAKAHQRRNEGGAFDEPGGRLYFRQMLHAVGFLHTSRIVHRDIKTENFLLLGDPASEGGSIIKLCDFGTAVQLSDQMPRAMGRIGTLSYTAPEIYNRKGADLCADLWSLGVVLYVILVGASPFRTTGNEPRPEISKRIVAGNYDTMRPGWQNLTDNAKDFVGKLLVVDEVQRLRLSEAFQQPWMEPSGALMALKEKQVVEQHRVLFPISEQEADLADYAHHIQKLLYLVTCFAGLDPLQQLLISVYAQLTPDSELADLDLPLPWYELFFALDADEDGRLGFSELARGLQKLVTIGLGEFDPKQEAKVNILVRALDLDGNGYVDWVEWTALALSSCSTLATKPEPLQTVFRVIDRPSGDGAITAVDLLALLNSDSAGRGLTTAQAQEQAQSLLNKWAPENAPGSPRSGPNGVAVAPSMRIEDVQVVLQAAAKQCSPFNDDDQIPWHLDEGADAGSSGGGGGAGIPKQLSWLRCCEMSRLDDRPELLTRLPVVPSVAFKDGDA
eukprot:TRINITY_DN72193_c0_g1_i1.p1 TRINITY_DN72193_c0_g1~~TRINITY_DN72193_c0_g1_i1.p1  ORF type:complete len:695 (-),score=128.95 TRINITY_DN72193_c0_g1_i1:69-2153(-)